MQQDFYMIVTSLLVTRIDCSCMTKGSIIQLSIQSAYNLV